MTLATSKTSIFSVLKARKFAHEVRRTDGNCVQIAILIYTPP